MPSVINRGTFPHPAWVRSSFIGLAVFIGLAAVRSPASAAVRVLDHYSTESGLAANGIKDILITEDRIWVAAESALCFQEGREPFACYTPANSAIPATRFLSLAEYRGKLYAGAEDGLVTFDGTAWEIVDHVNRVTLRNVRVAVDPGKNELWVASMEMTGGLMKFDGKDWTVLGGQGKGLVNNVSALAFRGDTVWVGNLRDGLYLITGNTWELIGQREGLIDGTVTDLALGGKAAWVATPSGAGRRIDGEWLWLRKEDGLISSYVLSIEIVEDRVFLGTTQGLIMVDEDGADVRIMDLVSGPGQPYVFRIRYDRNHDLVWVGTSHGLFKLSAG